MSKSIATVSCMFISLFLEVVHAADTGDCLHHLVEQEANDGNRFGRSVAVSGSLAIIGSPGSNAAYLYDVRSGKKLFNLVPSDKRGIELGGVLGDALGATRLEEMGRAVAINDKYAIVGTGSGVAYIFDTSNGKQLHRLVGGHRRGGNSGVTFSTTASLFFGSAVAIHTNRAVVGATDGHVDRRNGFPCGCAFLFDVKRGKHITKLTAIDGSAGDDFGEAVALSEKYVLVGSPHNDRKGAAYVFHAESGKQLHKLVPTALEEDSGFGSSVAVSGNMAMIGAPGDGTKESSPGSVYLFDLITGTQLRVIRPSYSKHGDGYGRYVAADGNIAIVGAYRYNRDQLSATSGWAFALDMNSGKELTMVGADEANKDTGFGSSVGVSGSVFIVGAFMDNINKNTGAAYLFYIKTKTP